MLPQRLIKHFPELAHLPTEEQHARLIQAQKNIDNDKHKLRALAENLLRAAILFTICLLFIGYLRPILGISHPTAAIMIMVLIIPAHLVIQHQFYLQKIRRELQRERA